MFKNMKNIPFIFEISFGRVFVFLSCVLVCIGLPDQARGQSEASKFRYMSFLIRDVPPTVQEAKDFYFKKKTLDQFIGTWLASPEHEKRINRYFKDMFGMGSSTFIANDEFDLIVSDVNNLGNSPTGVSESGVYHLRNSVKSDCGGTPVMVATWWQDTQIKICPSAVSDALQYNSGAIVCTSLGANGIFNAQCGCGPLQIGCYPGAQKFKVMLAVTKEFPERAVYFYKNNRSWIELFGGSTFYGDRWLYHHYLYQSKIVVGAASPSPAEFAVLASLPVNMQPLDNIKAEAIYPPDSQERSGVATSPSFLRRFNNFRSRIRALTERLLCKDIDPTLNTDGISVFVNPDLSAFDLAHGTQVGCAGCHYAMDNFGSTLLGWAPNGYYTYFNPKSQLGHVFGADGTGPKFLMDGYVNQAAGFDECMAKTAWQDFSGSSWQLLPEADRLAFTEAVALGPRNTIQTILNSDAIKKMRSPDLTLVKSTIDVVYSFADDVSPVIEASCAGSFCHSADSALGATYQYIGNEGRFKGVSSNRVADGSMPPASSGKSLTTEQREMLLLYLNQ